MDQLTDNQLADQMFSKASPVKSKDDQSADDMFKDAGLQNAVKQRSSGRQWLSPQVFSDMGQDAEDHPIRNMFFGAGATALRGVSALNQGVENSEARVADALLPGKQAAPDVDSGGAKPMEFGDVLASRGVPEGLSQQLGFLGSLAGNPLNAARPLGAAAGATVSGGANATRQAALKGEATVGASLMNKPREAVQYMIDNPDAVFTKDNLNKTGEMAQNLGNEIAGKLKGVAKMARNLYQQAGRNATDTPVNPNIPLPNGTNLVQSLEGHISGEVDQSHLDQILGKTAWSEPTNSNAYSMTHTYITPQPTGLVDSQGRDLMLPGQHSAVGTVSAKEGANVTKESQKFVTDPTTGQQRIAAVRTTQATSDRPSNMPVSVGEAIQRLQSGQPVTVKQLAGMHTALNSVPSATASKMAEDVSTVLAQHDPNFAKADQAWKSYKVASGQNGAGSLFGGISEPDFESANPYKAVNASSILGHFNSEPGSIERGAPGVIDRELSKYSNDPTNYAARVKALSAADKMNDFGPHGRFAQASLIPIAAETVGEHLPVIGSFMDAHPSVKAVAALTGLGINIASSKGINRKVIQALTSKGALPSGSNRLLQSPAGKYLMQTMRPGTLGAGAALSANQQQSEQSPS